MHMRLFRRLNEAELRLFTLELRCRSVKVGVCRWAEEEETRCASLPGAQNSRASQLVESLRLVTPNRKRNVAGGSSELIIGRTYWPLLVLWLVELAQEICEGVVDFERVASG